MSLVTMASRKQKYLVEEALTCKYELVYHAAALDLCG